MKLFVWSSDFFQGLAVAVAETVEEARQLIITHMEVGDGWRSERERNYAISECKLALDNNSPDSILDLPTAVYFKHYYDY